jgi:hypothetical protein
MMKPAGQVVKGKPDETGVMINIHANDCCHNIRIKTKADKIGEFVERKSKNWFAGTGQ